MDIGEDAITIATRLLKGRIAKQVWRDYHKHAFARRCYADPSDMGLKALQLSGMRREQDQTEREQLQLQHTLLTRLHHSWRRGIGWAPLPRLQRRDAAASGISARDPVGRCGRIHDDRLWISGGCRSGASVQTRSDFNDRFWMRREV